MRGAAGAALLALLLAPAPAPAADWTGDRYALALDWGTTYIGEKIRFLQGSLLVDLDPAPAAEALPPRDPWHYWLALGGGVKVNPPRDIMMEVVVLVQRHLRFLDAPRFHPYALLGIGVVYTGYRVRHQPLTVDFNDNVGFGFDVGPAAAPDFSVAVRWHHISNANLAPPNNGVNSVVATLALPLR